MSIDPAVLFVSTYPPTRCGLATFSKSLLEAIAQTRASRAGLGVAAVGGPDFDYPSEVVTHLHPAWGMRMPMRLTADFDVMVVQHEFGIFGANDGIAVLDLVRSATIPVIVVLHTVLPEPSDRQRRIIETLAQHAAALVVMSRSAWERLQGRYDLSGTPLLTIPHGAMVSQPPHMHKDLGHKSLRPVVLSWGLLGPGKGLEAGIRAMRRLRHLEPEPLYIIAGQTHPNVLASQGETYRDGLAKLAAEIGVQDMVQFINRYLSPDDLRDLRSRARVALFPYENRVQVTSGALVEAIGAGVPVVATRFPHAVELLSAGAGELVQLGDVTGMAQGLERLLVDPTRQAQAAAAISKLGPQLSWKAVGSAYNNLFAAAANEEVGAA